MKITFSGVSKVFEPDTVALRDIKFQIEKGEFVYVIGATGSGKSTLMYLLDRLYPLPADCGRITIGGTDIARIRLDYLRGNIGMVLQEPYLFSRTLRENLGIASESLSEEELSAAVRAACLEETVDSFARGYDTFVGERGVTLSGGQKQRAAIARTLAQRTPIMIFDDSLSAVDTETDAKIRAALKSHFAGATVILISHRITTLSQADTVLVLDKGRIAERGTPEELARAGGIYQKIYEIQTGMADLKKGGSYAG